MLSHCSHCEYIRESHLCIFRSIVITLLDTSHYLYSLLQSNKSVVPDLNKVISLSYDSLSMIELYDLARHSR